MLFGGEILRNVTEEVLSGSENIHTRILTLLGVNRVPDVERKTTAEALFPSVEGKEARDIFLRQRWNAEQHFPLKMAILQRAIGDIIKYKTKQY